MLKTTEPPRHPKQKDIFKLPDDTWRMRFKGVDIVVHIVQYSPIPCQRHKHKHVTPQMHSFTYIFLSSVPRLSFCSILSSACKCAFVIQRSKCINTFLNGFYLSKYVRTQVDLVNCRSSKGEAYKQIKRICMIFFISISIGILYIHLYTQSTCYQLRVT